MGFSPQKSVAHKQLLGKVKGSSRERVRELLWVINAPPDIEDIPCVFENLAKVLKCAERQWPGILEMQHLDWIPDALNCALKVFKGKSRLEISAQHGNRDWRERNALYCALRTTITSPAELNTSYRLLQAHYFFAHTALLVRNMQNPDSPTAIEDYESYDGNRVWSALKIDPYHAGLCIRDMADTEYLGWSREFLEKLPVRKTPRELPDDSSVKMTHSHDDFNVQKKVNYVSDFLRQVYGIKDRVSGRGSAPGPRLPSLIGDPEDDWLNFGSLSDWETEVDATPDKPVVFSSLDAVAPDLPPSSLASPDISLEDDEGDLEDGEVPGDEYPGEDETESFVGSLDFEDSEFQKSPGSFSGRGYGTCNQIVREQKKFAFGVERLSARELADLHRYVPMLLSQALDTSRQGTPLAENPERRRLKTGLNKMDEIEAYVFLLTMLWTGSSPERTATLVFAKSEIYLHEEPFALIVGDNVFGPKSYIIRVHVPFPEYKSVETPVPGSYCRSTEYLYLRDWNLLGWAVSIYATKARRRQGAIYRVFQGNLDRYKRNARTLLKAWDPTGRLTLNKIGATLFARVMSTSGNDAVAATMICGMRHRLSGTSMYYACREMSVLQEIYRKAVLNLTNEIEQEGPHPQPKSIAESDAEPTDSRPSCRYAEKPKDTIYLSRRLCPRDETFLTAIRNLTMDLKKKPYRAHSDESWIKFHNLYTFYTCWMFAAATGVRKIIDPYVDIRDVSPINGVAKLRDKDGESGVKAKLIWLPDLVREQMQNYSDHLEFVRKRFEIQQVDWPCFFLTKKGQAKRVRPGTQYKYVSEYLKGFPVDFHRRFMFNKLLDFGCPPEVVRVWMGHALVGEEWWADEATFSHHEYRRHLHEYLVPVLKYLELKPIRPVSCQKQARNQEMARG
jgi:hypothetical protein